MALRNWGKHYLNQIDLSPFFLLAVNLALQAINLVLAEAWPFLIGVVCVLAYGFAFFLKLLFWDAGDSDEAA
jgi:hypothetical protein